MEGGMGWGEGGREKRIVSAYFQSVIHLAIL